MAESDPALSPRAISQLSQSPGEELQDSAVKIKELDESHQSSPLSNSSNSLKEGAQPLGTRIEELDESHKELLSKIQGLKENVHSWRSTMDTQLKSYQNELSGLKKQLETELEELSLNFNELKTTLRKQQEDVKNSLKNLGLQDIPKHAGEPGTEKKDDFPDNTKEPTRMDASKTAESSQ